MNVIAFPMPPFRIGATSYVLPADLLPNVRFLAGKVQDVELVLFDIDGGQSNLPSPAVVAEMASLAEAHGLTFTVHLPVDLRLGAGGDPDHISLIKAKKVIDCTLPLRPWAYLAHLDGREIRQGATPAQLRRWQEMSIRALAVVAGSAGSSQIIALENLEGYPLDLLLPVIERIPVSRCVDIGHLWLDGHDALPYLREALPRTRVVHLHGIHERGHQSLSFVPPEHLAAVLQHLVSETYDGVLSLEVFGEADFSTSLEALNRGLSIILG